MRPIALLLSCSLSLLCACASDGTRKPTREEVRRQVEIFSDTATAYYAMGDDLRAEGQARRGLALDPKNEDLQLVLAWTLLRKGTVRDVREAEALFRKLQKKDDFRATLGLAQAQEQLGRAWDQHARARERGEEPPEGGDARGVAELDGEARESWRRAEASYLKTIEMHPGDEDALNGLQRTTALLGRLDDSVAWGRQLVAATDIELTFWRERLARPELTASEEADFRRFVRQSEGLQLASRLHLASVLRKLGRSEEAEAELSAVLALDPTRTDVIGRRAQLRASLGRWRDALADVEQYLRQTSDAYEHPDTQLAWRLKAECEEHLRAAEAR